MTAVKTSKSLRFYIGGFFALAFFGGLLAKTSIATADEYYVLALSWSPSYCAAAGEEANQDQCGITKRFSFIVHGLWHQQDRQPLNNCRTNRSLRTPYRLEDSMLDLMPSRGLIRHQWRKHGTCSGMSQIDYFNTVRQARETIKIPSQFKNLNDYLTVSPNAVRKAFLARNRDLKADGVVVTCDRRRLREVRICMTKDLEPRSCPHLVRKSCRQSKIVMPPIR